MVAIVISQKLLNFVYIAVSLWRMEHRLKGSGLLDFMIETLLLGLEVAEHDL